MATRLELHDKLCKILGNRNAYFQPPESVKLQYPCIIYNCDTPDVTKASDTVYTVTKCYSLLLIEREADSNRYEALLKEFPMCRCTRFFVTDGLYHKSLTLYF